MKQILLRMLQSIIFIIITVWILLSALLYIFQPKFVYFPFDKLETTPKAVNLDFENVLIKTEDNVNLHGWYVQHNSPKATLLFFHGNGGNISHRLDSLVIFKQLGLSTLIIDYRGYGQSEGITSEQGTYKDAKAAWGYLLNDKKLSEKDIIIFGRSLGAAVAAWLASQHTPRALILESAFTSIADIGKHYYPYLPTRLLVRIKYPTVQYIKNVNCPVLITHSPTDEIIPYKFGKKLFAIANEPKSFLEIVGGHNEGFIVSGNIYTNGLKEFLSTVLTH